MLLWYFATSSVLLHFLEHFPGLLALTPCQDIFGSHRGFGDFPIIDNIKSITMDKAIDSRFERLERALAALIDSVAKYNPSATQARDLENADHELSQGLDEGIYASITACSSLNLSANGYSN